MFANVQDTLLAHHAYASHFPQRLDFVVSEYCDSEPWKIQYRHQSTEEKGLPPPMLSGDELVTYNASDARLTALAWHRLQEDLRPEVDVYRHDLALAQMCHEMSWNGIRVDVRRRKTLSDQCRRRRDGLKVEMCSILNRVNFQPGRLGEVRQALFRTLRGKFIARTSTGLESTANATLEVLATGDGRLAQFAAALLDWRVVGKVKSTYLDRVEVYEDGFTHYNWKPFGTVSGRLSCRLQSCPRWSPSDPTTGLPTPEGRVREIYIPRPGHQFVYFDVSQAEMRIAAYLSNDGNFIAACAGDVHANNAKRVFPEIAAKGWLDGDAKKDPARGKPYRDIAKNLGFAIGYLAESEKVFTFLQSKGFAVSYKAIKLVLARLHDAYERYYQFAAANLESVRKCGFMRTPILGRIRWLGWFPKATDVANFPIQSCLADVMNARCIQLRHVLGRDALMVAQIHDAAIFDVPSRRVESVKRRIKEMWAPPIRLAGGDMVLPIDLKDGERWSDF